MGISNFFLLGIAVIHRDVERTLKSQSLKGKSVKNENGLSRRRERGGEIGRWVWVLWFGVLI